MDDSFMDEIFRGYPISFQQPAVKGDRSDPRCSMTLLVSVKSILSAAIPIFGLEYAVFEDEYYYICHDGRKLWHIRTES